MLPPGLKSFLKWVGTFISLMGIAIGMGFLTLRILVPSEKVEVPSIVGKDLREAILILSEQNLGLRVVGRKFSSEIPQDIIISQLPPPQVKVRKDRSIEVVISEGRRVVVIPSLIGKKVREAKVDLSRKGSKINTVSYVYSKAAQGEIVAQDPAAQISASRKEGLDILVSLGPRNPQFYMPDFRGKKLGEETGLLEKFPLNIGKIKEVPFTGEEGIVLSQSPLPGSQVDAETPVEFVVSAFYKEEKPSPLATRWVTTSVTVPWGVTGKEVKVEISDAQGSKTFSYGLKDPGEKVWLASPITGTGEMKIYVGGKLVAIKKVKGSD
jgi:serine/threonine-protein kinase